jgi:hypothetical protein
VKLADVKFDPIMVMDLGDLVKFQVERLSFSRFVCLDRGIRRKLVQFNKIVGSLKVSFFRS